MPEFYTILPEKIVFARIFLGGPTALPLPPVSYAYAHVQYTTYVYEHTQQIRSHQRHTAQMCKNWIINYLVQAAVPVCVYCTIIRSILEYPTCPVWHSGLTKNFSKDTEPVEKHCLKLLQPFFSYIETLNKSGLYGLDYRCDLITQNTFRQIKDPKRPLHYLISVFHSPMVLRPISIHISFHLTIR